MKKILVLAALVAAMFTPSLASAQIQRVEKNLSWSTGLDTLAFNYSGDTVKTAGFSIADAHPVNLVGSDGANYSDSLFVGHVLVWAADNNSHASLSVATATIQVGNGTTWNTIGTSAGYIEAAGQRFVAFPLIYRIAYPSANLLYAPSVRIVWPTSALTGKLSAARVKVVYYSVPRR